MKRSFAAVLLLLGFLLAGYKAYARADESVASPPPKIAALAREWFDRFRNVSIDRSQLDERVNAQLTLALVKEEGAKLRAYGKPTSFTYLGSNQVSYATGYYFDIRFAHGKVIEAIALDADGKIGGIDFQTFVPR